MKRERYCSVDGCENIHYAKGYCDKHYKNFNIDGNPIHIRKKNTNKAYIARLRKCKKKDCETLSYMTYCTKHKVELNPKCIIDGCDKNQISKGMCWTHYQRNRRRGNPNILLEVHRPQTFHGEGTSRNYQRWNKYQGNGYNGNYIDFKEFQNTKPDGSYRIININGDLLWKEYLSSRTPEYLVWSRMKTYTNKFCIYIHPEWKKSVLSFYKDIGSKPENTFLCRIDTSKGFTPENCQWKEYKLSKEKAKKIRKEYLESDLNFKELGIKYGVTGDMISLVVNNLVWKK
ncbi:hypothetical protein KAR91_12990 [Candidatus Pacearchaeota archaeon]|nr:hypothetical protein [Candidatus Pacearchaeota archaeon]